MRKQNPEATWSVLRENDVIIKMACYKSNHLIIPFNVLSTVSIAMICGVFKNIRCKPSASKDHWQGLDGDLLLCHLE